jgi:uncharacterized protein (TIGR02145 family)
MKALINSLKRTHWFKTQVAFLTCLLFLTFPSCQKDELNQDPMLNMDNMSSSKLPISYSGTLYYAPERFILPQEGTLVATRIIENKLFENFGNEFVLKVQNGSSGYETVSTVEIKIDGKLIITSSDFNEASLIEKKLASFNNPAQLDITLAGNKWSSIELWIEGTLKHGKIRDVDGNTYKTVKIGTQWWMAENLKTTKYLNGDLIGTTTPATLDIFGESTPKYQWSYDGDESNVATYGRLYTWFAITDSRNVCPRGWHVPTDEEWTTLTDYLGGESVAGGKLKETGSTHWLNATGTNESGFTALPGGIRNSFGYFYIIGAQGYWWSATEYDVYPFCAWYRYLNLYTNNVLRYGDSEKVGYSVRCLKDN